MASNPFEELGFNLQIIPVTDFQQNAMIFWSTKSMNGVLIDPGGEVDRLMEAVEKLGANITAIWLTHGHMDHTGGAAESKRRLNCEIIGPHKDDQFLLDELKSGMYGIEEAESFTPDRYLSEGDTLELEGLKFNILHCPGHSPGSIVMHQPDISFAIMGDVLFNGSIGRTDLPRSNHQDLIDSITKKLWPLQIKEGKDIGFIPGHGPASTFLTERKSNAFVSDSALGLATDK